METEAAAIITSFYLIFHDILFEALVRYMYLAFSVRIFSKLKEIKNLEGITITRHGAQSSQHYQKRTILSGLLINFLLSRNIFEVSTFLFLWWPKLNYSERRLIFISNLFLPSAYILRQIIVVDTICTACLLFFFNNWLQRSMNPLDSLTNATNLKYKFISISRFC